MPLNFVSTDDKSIGFFTTSKYVGIPNAIGSTGSENGSALLCCFKVFSIF